MMAELTLGVSIVAAIIAVVAILSSRQVASADSAQITLLANRRELANEVRDRREELATLRLELEAVRTALAECQARCADCDERGKRDRAKHEQDIFELRSEIAGLHVQMKAQGGK